MKSNKKRPINFFSLFFVSLSLIFFALLCVFCFSYFKKRPLDFNYSAEERNYHVLIVGSYENQLFLQQVFEGAEKISARYNVIVELYAPKSYAQNESLQNMFDYASFANADAVIVYVDSAENIENIRFPQKKDTQPIPIINLGLYAPQIPQVAYVGHSYSEFGKRTAEEALNLIDGKGFIFILQGDLGSTNYNSNFMNSFNSVMKQNDANVRFNVLTKSLYEFEIQQDYGVSAGDNIVFIAMNENDAIRLSQNLTAFSELSPKLIGIGNNEVTQNLFNRGSITEIISVDPEKIGELAIMELFEYLNKSYANNYITAEVQVIKAGQK